MGNGPWPSGGPRQVPLLPWLRAGPVYIYIYIYIYNRLLYSGQLLSGQVQSYMGYGLKGLDF